MDDRLDDMQQQIERQQRWEAQKAAEWAQSLRDAEALAAQAEPTETERLEAVEAALMEMILGGMF